MKLLRFIPCLNNEVESALAESQAMVMSASQHRQCPQKQQLQNQHMLESQSSINSGTSVQTVLFQSAIQTPTHSMYSAQLQRSTTSSGNHSCDSYIAATSTASTTALAEQSPTAATPNGQAAAVPYATEALSINSLLEHMNPANAPMNGEGVLNIADVADLLHPQHAIITGGRSQDGCPLIIFPDNNNFHVLEEADYQKLILYLTSVPSLQDADLGFHLIIDRRKDKWTSVKTVLQRISIYFPGIIHVVYVLRPCGLFQKAISEVSSKFSKDEYRFRLVICSALADLHEFVDKTQLTADMGGDLVYSHHEWIQQRISLEKFSSLTHQVSAELDVFIQAIHDTEFPNSVEATQSLLDMQGADYKRLKNEILSAAKHGETLLSNIKSNEEFKEFSERTGNVSAIER